MKSGHCLCKKTAWQYTGEASWACYCHCDDCRRWTGSAAPVFAAFEDDNVAGLEAVGPSRSFAKGVDRWNCAECGSPLLGRFDYLPGQSWVPLGMIEDAKGLAPTFHCFADRRHDWVPEAGLPGSDGTGRDVLNAAKDG